MTSGTGDYYSRPDVRRSRAGLSAKASELSRDGFLDDLCRRIGRLSVPAGSVLLDFGGGNGATAELLGARVGARRKICYDLVEPGERADGVEYVVGSWSDLEGAVGTAGIDVLVAEEMIEHVFDTDALAALWRKLLRPGGILVVTTPNLSSAVNRIALLLGRQPGGTEISTIFRPGEPGPAVVPLAGHIRVFAFGALQEFLRFHRFTVRSAYTVPSGGTESSATGANGSHGFDAWIDRLSFRFSKSLASRSIVIATSPDDPAPST